MFAVRAAVAGWLLVESAMFAADLKPELAQADRLYRAARFDEAEDAYASALELDGTLARAELGLGKIAWLRFQSDRARTHFSRAFQTAPHDPDAILAFASVVEGVARRTLLANFLALNHDARNSDVKARLEVEQKLAGRRVSQVRGIDTNYEIPLFGSNGGREIHARLNGRDVRLLLDTGASGVILNASAARPLDHLEILANSLLTGFGTSTPHGGRLGLASTLEIGRFELADVVMNMSETDLVPGADGLIGLDVFRDFQIDLDFGARTLHLAAFPPADAAECAGCIQAYRLGHLLLVSASLNNRTRGYFILDTGSPLSLISRTMLAPAARFEGGVPLKVQGVQGFQDAALKSTPLSFRIGPMQMLDFKYAALDTSDISAREGTEVSGALGYGLLRDLRITFDYRTGVLRLLKK